jgi:hypothetical protein
LLLKLLQTRGIGRTDIDDDIVGDGVYTLEGYQVIVGGLLQGYDATLADIDAEDAIGPAMREAFGDGGRPVVIEPQAVYEGSIPGKTKEPGRRIARLGMARDGADLYEAKSKSGEGGRPVAVFVEACGKAYRV